MKPETLERRQNIVNIMSQNEEFIIIGLTGRVGSGCSEAAEIFGSTYQQLELPWIQPGIQGLRSNEDRDFRILQRYASAHWIKFDIIRTRTIISSFLLEDFESFIQVIAKQELKASNGSQDVQNEKIAEIKTSLYSKMCSVVNKNCQTVGRDNQEEPNVEDLKKQIQEILASISSKLTVENGKIPKANPVSHDQENTEMADETQSTNEESSIFKQGVESFRAIGRYYGMVDNGECTEERSRYISRIEESLSSISAILAEYLLQAKKQNIWEVMKKIETDLENSPLENSRNEDNSQSIDRLKRFVFVRDLMPALGDAIHDYLLEKHLPFTELFQKYGNSIRCYGKIWCEKPNTEEKAADIFSIPRRIVRFIKALRHPFSSENCRPVRIVIDSIKNVFEATYLRQRYSSFYLFAISADESIRRERLMNSEKKSMTMEQIRFIDWNEYSSEGVKVYNQIKMGGQQSQAQNNSKIEHRFYDKIVSGSDDTALIDYVRKDAYDKKLQQFYLQDVAASIENADVFISNNCNNEMEKNTHLLWAIVRNVCLIMFPGLLLPTPIEKCMQIAFAAKCNSGCLSRQVGAVVTDAEYNILSIGCNDVPCGDISCARKNLVDLCKLEDGPAYTKYELTDPEFRQQIMKFQYRAPKLSRVLRGLPMRYCFKDIHLKDKTSDKNPMRSRAMHAEEKALYVWRPLCRRVFVYHFQPL